MAHGPTLRDFIDDELLRAPLALNPVIDAVLQRWRLRSPGQTMEDVQADRTLQLHREDVIARALRALRQAALTDLQRIAQRSSPTPLAPLPLRRELSLIGEDDVAADIEVARCIESVKLHAETELRELQTYTSALAHDLNVSRDTNPFRPELYVRALWDGVSALPISRLAQAAFLREAAEPLARALRQNYAAAVSRLEDQGVVPAAYRTIVQTAGGTGWGGQLPRWQPPEHLSQLREQMPVSASDHQRSADLLAATAPVAPYAWTPTPPPPPATDPRVIELLSRLFDLMQNDNGLSPDVVALLLRLQPTVTRVALFDTRLMEDYDHPAWRFMDHLAYQMALCAAGERLRLLSLGRNLVDHLASGDAHDRQRFEWAIERLVGAHRQALQQAVAAAAPVIARMQHKARSGANTSTPMPLDFGNLDTVPADVALDAVAPPLFDPSSETPGTPGDHWRIYLQGDWRWVQLLWRDDDNEVWLLREPAADRHWALRVHGIERLRQEGLAHPLRMRSLVRRAAAKLQRSL